MASLLWITIFIFGCTPVAQLDESVPKARIITKQLPEFNDNSMFLVYQNYRDCKGVYQKMSTNYKLDKHHDATLLPANGPQSLLLQRVAGNYRGATIITFIPEANKEYVLVSPIISKKQNNRAGYVIRIFEIDTPFGAVKGKKIKSKPVKFIKRKFNPNGISYLPECIPGDIDEQLKKLKDKD